MRTRLLALSLVILGFTLLGLWLPKGRSTVDSEVGEQIAVVPPTLFGRSPVRRWRYQRPKGVIEEGALFPGHGGDDVQLDYYRHYAIAHHGIVCYVTRGETLLTENLRSVSTSEGPAVFDVAFLQASGELRLVATTECTAKGCAEELVSPPSLIEQFAAWFRVTATPSRTPNVVPISIVLTHPVLPEGQPAIEQRLLTEFSEAASQLDLSPARSLAAAQ